MSDKANPLGTFLRARRELITPERARIAAVGVRRVPGLRREEVALLAGVSAEYYLRLEQGRYRNPSPQILDALARALQLDDESTSYVHSLADETRRTRRRRAVAESVPPGIQLLLADLPMPAFVEGRYLDVLAANPLAAAVSPRLVAGRNRARDLFLEPDEQDLFIDYDLATEGLVASLRSSAGADADDERFIDLVGRLSIESARFRKLWARHDIGGRVGALVRLDHPLVGQLHLHREKLIVGEARNLTIAIYHAAPGTEHAEKLALLISSIPSPAHDGLTEGVRRSTSIT